MPALYPPGLSLFLRFPRTPQARACPAHRLRSCLSCTTCPAATSARSGPTHVCVYSMTGYSSCRTLYALYACAFRAASTDLTPALASSARAAPGSFIPRAVRASLSVVCTRHATGRPHALPPRARVRYDVPPRAEAKPWPNPSRAAARERLHSALGLCCLFVSRWRLRQETSHHRGCGLPLACLRSDQQQGQFQSGAGASSARAARGPVSAAAACRVRRYMLGRARGS